MKKLVCIVFVSILCSTLYSQTSEKENDILKLEKEWTELLDKNDTIALSEIWTDDYIVNNASGKIANKQDILALLKSGHKFPKVDRYVEKITFNGDLAIVIGAEIEYSKNGDQKKRRFTNVWRESNDGWKLIARQANGN